ncbi:MAG: hypothetical protein DMG21_08010 [Acidobacteria bacterium]|nr:MAG: hypothetical protein DMG21_08010 [Acidobacteriota bacterium]
MGLDFAEKVARSFRKGARQQARRIGNAHLFTQQPECSRAYAATMHKGQEVALGDKLGVRLDGDRVVALRALTPVATFNNPPADSKQALTASHGVACGTVKTFTTLRKLRRLQYVDPASQHGRRFPEPAARAASVA